MGLLEVSGTLNVNQFWPSGTSDADTTKLLVKVGPGSFRFNGKTTRAFANAYIGTKPVVNKKSCVTIRLQGIDAPELHYRPTYQNSKARTYEPKERSAINKVNAEFRQKLAETGTNALAKFLHGTNSAEAIPCLVRTRVASPGDVFDKYGRLVGDVYVKIAGHWVDVNHWLVEQGWAFPAFYNSMQNDEIDVLRALAASAEKANRGVWKLYPLADTRKFDFKLRYRRNAKLDAKADHGAVSFPKLFRRVATWRVLARSAVSNGSFTKYLKAHPDDCYVTSEFEKVRKGLTADPKYLRRLDAFLRADGGFKAKPGDLVFKEAGSLLRGKSGKPVARW